MKKNILSACAGVAFSLTTIAQNYDITGVKGVRANNISPITENQELKGYYSFVALDKASKTSRNYNLAILDNNLKQLYTVDMVKANKLALLESSYNGAAFCFSYYNADDKKLEYELLDKTGVKTGKYSLEISKNEGYMYAQMLKTEDDAFQGTLVGVKGKGFIRFGYEKEEGYRISIEMIDNIGKKKWSATSNATTKKSFETVSPLFTDDKVCILGLTTREKMMRIKDMVTSVVFLNTDNGKEFFRLKDIASNGFQLSPLGASFDATSQTYFVYGQFFNAEDNMSKDDSKGFYMQEVNLTGKIISESYTKWEDDINTTIVRKAKGDIKGNMKMMVHSVVRTADGKVFAIAEQYRKAVSAAGMGLKALSMATGGGGGPSAMKIETHDMVCLEFDSKLKFKDATIFDKQKSNIALPEGWGAIDANKLGMMMKLYGYFDYSFTITSSDKKTFYSTYVDYEKNKEAGSSYSIGNIAYTKDQKLTFDKILLTTKPTDFYVFQAKPGYIAIVEYFRKQKKVTLRLEKLNM
jgi:hypothetical protein